MLECGRSGQLCSLTQLQTCSHSVVAASPCFIGVAGEDVEGLPDCREAGGSAAMSSGRLSSHSGCQVPLDACKSFRSRFKRRRTEAALSSKRSPA